MNKQHKLLVIIVAILLIILFFFKRAQEKEQQALADLSTKYSAQKDFVLVGGVYEVYKPEKLAYAKQGKVLLFFNASWCPSCNEFEDELKHVSIPNNVLLLSIDYDNSDKMRQKYEVALQHTFVQVDENGNLIKKWSGGGVEGLKKELQLTDNN